MMFSMYIYWMDDYMNECNLCAKCCALQFGRPLGIEKERERSSSSGTSLSSGSFWLLPLSMSNKNNKNKIHNMHGIEGTRLILFSGEP